MSKIGEKTIEVPQNVQIDVKDNLLSIKGTLGRMEVAYPAIVSVEKQDNTLQVKRSSESKHARSMHGLIRSLIANAVAGVEKHWQKRLEVVGTGYNAKMQGEDLVLKVGYSHPVTFKKVSGVIYKVEGNNKIIIEGVDKQLVGEVAYRIKAIKKPDPYKGKGVRFEGERIRIKPGKKAKAAA